MMCPRWLVQSSAIGVVATAAIAVPLWWVSPPVDGERAGVEELGALDETRIALYEPHHRGREVEWEAWEVRDEREVVPDTDEGRVVDVWIVRPRPGPQCGP